MNAPPVPPDGSRWRNKSTGNIVVIECHGNEAFYRSESDAQRLLAPALPWTFAMFYERLDGGK